MSIKTIFSWLLLLFGEIIIVTAFILFRGNTSDDIFILNIVVSSIIYGLFFCNYRAPWIDFNDKTQRQIGALGISWFATWFYAIFAIATMLLANLELQFVFTTQLIIHCILLFILLLWLLLAQHSADKVKEVYEQQTANRNGIIEMKKAVNQLKDKMSETTGMPVDFTRRINALDESLRFISPTENEEAHSLENSFIETVNAIRSALTDYSLNTEQIEINIKKCERIYQNRKQIYSN
jgi:hypothetical protein